MLQKLYNFLFFTITALLTHQWLVLNGHIVGPDLISLLPAYNDINRSTEPGRPISLFLGYTGFGIMVLIIPYLFRKRLAFMRSWGSLNGWLNFHIFCGSIGPIFIIYHTNFKVGGLVAISFWSMILSAGSGFVGKFFYTKITQGRSALLKSAEKIDDILLKHYTNKEKADEFHEIKLNFFSMIGVPADSQDRLESSVIKAVFSTVFGDLKFYLLSRRSKRRLPPNLYKAFKDLAFLERKIYFL
ncbi:MAG: hypothetical protein HON90_02175, partial [Halobacteriovoraceae bacterium]|nr:hypothetical protein [Halobacteriovoraceae bacterium]